MYSTLGIPEYTIQTCEEHCYASPSSYGGLLANGSTWGLYYRWGRWSFSVDGQEVASGTAGGSGDGFASVDTMVGWVNGSGAVRLYDGDGSYIQESPKQDEYHIETNTLGCESCPTTYEGTLTDGRSWYVRYRWGHWAFWVDDVEIESGVGRGGWDGTATWEELRDWIVAAGVDLRE